MDTCIVLRDLSQSEIDVIAKRPNTKVWAIEDSNTTAFPFAWQKINIDHDWMQLASDIIKTFPQRVYNGKKVVEQVKHRSSFLFFLTRFILFNRFFQAYKEVTIVEELIAKHNLTDNIYVSGSSPYLKYFSFSENVKLDIPSSTHDKIPKIRFAILTLLRTLISLTQIWRYKRAKHLFLNPPVKLIPIIDKKTLNLKPGNPPVEYYLDDLLEKKDAFVLEEFYPLREVDYSFSRSNLLGIFRNKTIFFEPFLVRQLLTPSTWRDQKKQMAAEETLYKLIDAEEKDPIIKLVNRINFDLRALRKLGVLRINASKSFFTKNMKTFGCIDEHSLRVKSILESAAEEGLMTYAIQHGVIHKFHHSYVYLKNDHNYLYTPNKTFTFGSQAADVLIKHGNFPVEKVQVSGQLRTDIIPILKNSPQNSKALDNISNKPVILYASQPEVPSNDSMQRDLINTDFFRLSKDFPQYHFVLKPHPREVNHQYFHNIAKSVGTKNYQIFTDDLYLLLSKAAVVITNNSTVGAEAIYFDKPLLVMDYSKLDPVDYIKEGVGIPAHNYLETKSSLPKIINGELRCDPEVCENYRLKYTGTIDGKVSQRILNTIID